MFKKSILLKAFCSLCAAFCFLTLFGCSKDIAKASPLTYPTDISDISDFKCICSTDNRTEFVIENDNAKILYSYITKQWSESEKAVFDGTKQDFIYLSFQDGEPLLLLTQEPKAEISNAPSASEEHFYGVFWIHENDYMVFTATPLTSFQIYYKLPEGTYRSILQMIER